MGVARGPTASWVLDEKRFAGRENLDAGHVASYDDKEDSNGPAEAALLSELGLGQGSIVIDMGAGTGQFSLAAAELAASVIAVDISPLMVERLRSKVDATGLRNMAVIEAGFLTYEHTGPPADFVYCRWALHHLPDFWKAIALQRMHRSLRVGGVLRLSDIVYSFDSNDAAQRLDAWCAVLPETAPAGEWVRADIEEHIRDEHSTFTWLLEPMIERCGFTIERAEHSRDGIYAEYIARAQ